jgi:outer membrane biosynthesis protein TonB
MIMRICSVLCFAAAISVTMAAQEPVLVSANIPKHPPLACQARIEGSVKLSFTLAMNDTAAENVEVISGHALLKNAAVENLSTWRFESHHPDGKFETTFVYRIPSSGLQSVTFESFHRVEVATCLLGPWQP